MNIGIIGTGPVARLLAGSLSAAGHAVSFGSREPTSKSLEFPVVSLDEAVANAELVINATPGSVSLETLTGIGPDAFANKVVVDVANATTPGFDLAYPNSSLGERLQEALPSAKVVKTMNTAAMEVITHPSAVPASSVFVSGNDAQAKELASSLLKDLGWSPDAIIDLGGIETARGAEHYLPLFVALMRSQGVRAFNIKVVKGE